LIDEQLGFQRRILMQSKAVPTTNEVSRREFLRLAMMSSALLMGTSSVLEGEELAPHACLRELAPGAVRPEGWLREMLEKQAAQLGSKLPQISWPFTGAYWAGEEKDESVKAGQSWFPWEQKGYWIDGAVRLAIVLEDKALMQQVWAPINYTLTHPDAEGYLGPKHLA
jgi:uncharacterized protein